MGTLKKGPLKNIPVYSTHPQKHYVSKRKPLSKIMTDNTSNQRWVKFDETDGSSSNNVTRSQPINIDPIRMNEDKYTAFAQLDKSPESKGWSEKVQPTPVMGWSKEILQN